MTALRYYKCKNDHVRALGYCVYECDFDCHCGEQYATPITYKEADTIFESQRTFDFGDYDGFPNE